MINRSHIAEDTELQHYPDDWPKAFMSSMQQCGDSLQNFLLSPSLLLLSLFVLFFSKLWCWSPDEAMRQHVAAAPLGYIGDGGLGATGSLYWMQMRPCWLTLSAYTGALTLPVYLPFCVSYPLYFKVLEVQTILHLCLNHDNNVHSLLSCQTPSDKTVDLFDFRHAV